MEKHCFWLTEIKGQGGREYYCDIAESPYFKCEGCQWYVSEKEAHDIIYEYALNGYVEWGS
jgi:hypothetical protein